MGEGTSEKRQLKRNTSRGGQAIRRYWRKYLGKDALELQREVPRLYAAIVAQGDKDKILTTPRLEDINLGTDYQLRKERSKVQRTHRSLEDNLQLLEKNFPGVTRGSLARHNGPKGAKLYKRLWRQKGLDTVPLQKNTFGPWAGDAWGHYVETHFGKTSKEIPPAFYKALQRQIIPAGTLLPDGTATGKSVYANELLPRKRKKRRSTGD